MSEDALYWDASYEIVQVLMEKYPSIDLDDMGTQQLFEIIVQLPNFADDPAMANESILNGILREWYEEKMT